MARAFGTALRVRLVLPFAALASILGASLATLPAQGRDCSGGSHPPSETAIGLPDEVFAIAVDGDRVHVLRSFWSGGGWGGPWQGSILSVYDLSGSESPAFLGSMTVPNGFGARGLAVEGGFAYITTSFEFLVEDVSDPAALHSVGSLEWGPPYQPGCIATAGGRAYVGDAVGLHAVDVADPAAPSMLGSIALSSEVVSVALDGAIVYVGTSDAHLAVVNVSNPRSPALVSTLALPGIPWDIRVQGSRAYVSGGESGLLILDVSRPAQPRIMGGVDTPGDARRVAVGGARAYVVDRHTRAWGLITDLRVIDVSDPKDPVIVNSIAGIDRDEGNNYWATSQDRDVVATKGSMVVGGTVLHVWQGDCLAGPWGCEYKTGYLNVAARAAYESRSPCSDAPARATSSPAAAARASDASTPAAFGLRGNDPNPFNPVTVIRFDVPRASRARIRVFDARGRLVRTLVDDALQPGRHEVTWRGRDESDEAVASGIYFVTMEAEAFRQTRKITLMK